MVLDEGSEMGRACGGGNREGRGKTRSRRRRRRRRDDYLVRFVQWTYPFYHNAAETVSNKDNRALRS